MPGMEDPWVAAPYGFCILSWLCVMREVLQWNKENIRPESEKNLRLWAEEEGRVEEEL
jgi:hypothetical protein